MNEQIEAAQPARSAPGATTLGQVAREAYFPAGRRGKPDWPAIDQASRAIWEGVANAVIEAALQRSERDPARAGLISVDDPLMWAKFAELGKNMRRQYTLASLAAHGVDVAKLDRDRHPDDADHNAPWLSQAHALCSDHGIPQGHISDRIERLREALARTEPVAATMRDAIAAGDGTLHGAIDYWQERVLKAEAAQSQDALDAARYRHLRAKHLGMSRADMDGPAHPQLQYYFDIWAQRPGTHNPQGLDAAIDSDIEADRAARGGVA